MPRFGRQHRPGEVVAMAVLFAGFSALALAFHAFTTSWLGTLLPVAYVIGLWASMRTEVRQLDLGADALYVRTFFRSYRMPREHIIRVVRTPLGPAVDVLNGSRYTISPVGADPSQVTEALEHWMHPAG